MVDIKREDITLQDRTKGISADEFAWGSYFYSEGIQSGYNTKWFKLWYYVNKDVLNYRANGYPVAMCQAPSGDGMAYFTKDGRIETQEIYNGSLSGNGDGTWGGALFVKTPTLSDYINGITYGTKAIAIRDTKVDVIDMSNLFDPYAELLTQPKFESSASDRTVGTWWTLTDSWMEHTTGNTGTLSVDFTIDALTYWRVAVKVKDRTAWKITVDSGNLTDIANSNGWFTVYDYGSAWTKTLTITPSSDFDGTIEMVNVHQVDSSSITYAAATITSSATHPCLIWGGDLYIGSGNKVDIVSLSDRGVITKDIVDQNETIVDITQQAWNIIIWTTDYYNSRQYYRNGVDSVATEVIEWKGLVIKWVVGTETISYVLTTTGISMSGVDRYQYRLYAVSGYQRSLLTNIDYNYATLYNGYYNSQKKFSFSDINGSKSMCLYRDSLYIPGHDCIYKYWSDIPGLKACWTNPLVYDLGATKLLLGQRGNYLGVCFTSNWVNYTAKSEEFRYTAKWYLVTESIYRDKLGTRKALDKLKIWYKNVASEDGNIKIYAMVDDDYFWRFGVSGITTRPKVWDVYTVANQTKAEIISVDKTNNIIQFRTIENKGSYANVANTSLTKVSGDGDNSITVTWYDNRVLVKTITNTEQWYGSDLIFGKDFVDNYLPYRHKIQLVVELNSSDRRLSPEIFEIWIQSDITDVVL